MKKKDLLKRIEELERRVAELELQPKITTNNPNTIWIYPDGNEYRKAIGGGATPVIPPPVFTCHR